MDVDHGYLKAVKDIIVVRGDIVTNINLHEALKMHFRVKEMESDPVNMPCGKTIMTKLFLKQNDNDPKYDQNTDIALLMDSQTKEILKYSSRIQENQKVKREIVISDEHLPCHKSYGPTFEMANPNFVRCKNEYPKGLSMEVRSDLIDTEIAICTVEVFDHFKDNHDKT